MRRDLPSGTVTFLFTDVQGSTRLLHELGAEDYADALAEHRRLIREACSAEGGVEVDTQGDAFFFAFPTAPGALAAAATLTAALAAGPVQVRVGLHTGTPFLAEEGYVGADVHRAARIAAAGHGGQVLVSSSTAALVDGPLVDLGEHRFKDLAATERVFQAGDGTFPQLRSLFRSNLPVPAHPLVGRKKELLDVMRLLTHEDARIVTVTGPGGVGKTRLAVAVAGEVSDAFADGTWFVSLAPLGDPSLVLATVAAAVGAEQELEQHFGSGASLLLLDNFEHLIVAAPEIAELVSRCPGLRVLVTSRESLQVAPEREYLLSPLSESPSVELFRQRAAAVAPEHEIDYLAAAAICERVDRLPLAIELAAARSKVLSPAQILERLSARLDLLKGGRDADPRQHTLRATIEWSYELLAPEEQELFARLAAFVGGCRLDAAEEVCDADVDTMQSLVEKSLLRFSNERYWMLGTIHELAQEKLEAGASAEELRRRHAEYFLELGLSLGLTMESIERVRVQRHDIAIAEQNNFRAAIDWASGADPELAVAVAFSVENFWVTHDPHEGIRRFDALLEHEEELPAELRAAAHRCRGNVLVMSGDRSGGVADYEAAAAGFREAGNEVGALAAEHRALINREDGDLDERRRGLEGLLERFRALGLATGEVQVLGSLAGVEARLGDTERAAELLEEAADRAASIGFVWIERGQRDSLARLHLEQGRLDAARDQGLRALELAARAGDRLGTVYALTFFARLAARRGDNDEAGALWGALEAEADRRPLGLWAAEERVRVEASLPLDDADFERGRERGTRLSLNEAVEYALASIN